RSHAALLHPCRVIGVPFLRMQNINTPRTKDFRSMLHAIMRCVNFRAVLLLIAAMLVSHGAGLAQGSGSATLDAVRARGQSLCGTGGEIPGFSMLDSNSAMRGLDADYRRAIAAAVLGDSKKVRFVP